jgi:hypothetical protein
MWLTTIQRREGTAKALFREVLNIVATISADDAEQAAGPLKAFVGNLAR